MSFTIKTMSKQELADAYGISTKTLRGWFARMKKKGNPKRKQQRDNNKLLTPAEVQAFVTHHGRPE